MKASPNELAIHRHRQALVEHRERLLDEALAQSFPASDPTSISSAIVPPFDIGRGRVCLDKGGGSSIFHSMSERSQFGRPELHPGSSTARF